MGIGAVFGVAKLDCFEVDFREQLAVVNDAAGQEAAFYAEVGGVQVAGDY